MHLRVRRWPSHDPSRAASWLSVAAYSPTSPAKPSQSDRGPRGGSGHTPSSTTNTPFWSAVARSHVVRDPPRIETSLLPRVSGVTWESVTRHEALDGRGEPPYGDSDLRTARPDNGGDNGSPLLPVPGFRAPGEGRPHNSPADGKRRAGRQPPGAAMRRDATHEGPPQAQRTRHHMASAVQPGEAETRDRAICGKSVNVIMVAWTR
jgi:hypothetical protein